MQQRKNILDSEGLGNNPIKASDTSTGFGSLTNAVSPITVKDINDGIMPQSKVINDFVDRQLTYRMQKDLDNMNNMLSISKNKVLTEANDNDYDIVIDDKLFEKDKEDE